jgi:hypothetical protein
MECGGGAPGPLTAYGLGPNIERNVIEPIRLVFGCRIWLNRDLLLSLSERTLSSYPR